MSTPVKESVKVTSGKDTAAFVAAKPKETTPVEQKEPEVQEGTDALAEAHAKRMRELDKEFEQRKKQVAAEEEAHRVAALDRMKKLEAHNEAELKRINEARDRASVESNFAVRDFEDDDHPTNSRGRPIPVEDQPQRVRHISELDASYNGKDDTIRTRSKD